MNQKQKQLRKGITGAEVERRTTERDAARLALAQAGEQGSDELDIGTVVAALSKAERTLKEKELALSVAQQKDTLAQAELTEADRAVAVATEAAARARLAALGPKGEAILAAVTQFSTEMEDAADALRLAGGNERYAYSMGEARAQWELFLGIAKRPPSARAADSGAFRKYQTFADCLEAICGTGERA